MTHGETPLPLPAGYFQLRLFITGSTPRSTRAVESVRRMCEDHLSGCYELEVIDVYQHPEATRDFQIVATPTLVKVQPAPVRRFIGDLADTTRILQGLNLPAALATRSLT